MSVAKMCHSQDVSFRLEADKAIPTMVSGEVYVDVSLVMTVNGVDHRILRTTSAHTVPNLLERWDPEKEALAEAAETLARRLSNLLGHGVVDGFSG